MIRISKVTMTMRELDRLKCIQGLIDGQLKQYAVATRLGLTTRQVRRLVQQYQQQGPVGLISKLREANLLHHEYIVERKISASGSQ